MSTSKTEMPISLMLVILLYFLTGFSDLLSLVTGKGIDIIGIAMLPIGIALFMKNPIGVLGLKILGGFYTVIWMFSLLLGSISESGSAELSLFSYSISVAPLVAHLFFLLFCVGQLYVAFIAAPNFFRDHANT